MPSINGNAKKVIKGLFWFPLLLVGVSAATYTQVIPEPAKLLLLGAFLIGLAFWGKKQLAEHGVRTTDNRQQNHRLRDNRQQNGRRQRADSRQKYDSRQKAARSNQNRSERTTRWPEVLRI